MMVVLVIFVQVMGMVLIPLLLAGFILPYLAERFEQRVPRAAERGTKMRRAADPMSKAAARLAARATRSWFGL